MTDNVSPLPIWDRHDPADLFEFDAPGGDVYVPRCYEPNRGGGMFGGQLLGQALAAASRTVDDRALHAFQVMFLRPGVGERALAFRVERTRDGRGYSSRRVTASQGPTELFRLDASFQAPAQGFEHQEAGMPDVPGPEGLATLAEFAARQGIEVNRATRERFFGEHPIEFRPVVPEDLLLRRAARPNLAHWLRLRVPVPDRPGLAESLLAYASDWLPPFVTGLVHVASMFDPAYFASTLNHAMWFHRRPPWDGWLLCEAQSPIAAAGRGVTHAQYFTRDGVLVATLHQEALLQQRMPAAAPVDP
ncbi:MAG: acyl-CoA thioesterase [Gammaproteobacteria bacterium]